MSIQLEGIEVFFVVVVVVVVVGWAFFVLEMHYVFWDPIIFSQLVMHIDFANCCDLD
jgi:hypothetical protein